jgi:ferric iron reductase protein FhuF
MLLEIPAELAPIASTLDAVRARHGAAPVHGLAPGLVVDDPSGWLPATRFTDGSAIPRLLAAAHDRWGASPHVAAALAWKSYTYWLTLPAVLGYAAARRVPLMSADNVLVRLHVAAPFLEIGLRSPEIAVLPGDPLCGQPHVRVVDDLVPVFRHSLMEAHLAPVLDRLRERVHVGRRTLLGSVASGVAYALVRSSDTLPGPIAGTAQALLSALAVDDLVELTPDLRVLRRTCCLAFTLPEPKVCQGCCIRA